MSFRFRYFSNCLTSVLLLLASCVQQESELTENGWPPITHESKPWTRWWWHGSAVTGAGITKELEEFNAAGFGGVEITPIYGVYGREDQFIDYLSSRWITLLIHTLKEADRLGMGVDMATGTGWPFGGPWVSDVDACKNFKVRTYDVNNESSVPARIEYQQTPFLRTVGFNVPGKQSKKTDTRDLKDPVSENTNLQFLAIDQVQFAKPLPLVTLMAYNENGTHVDITNDVDQRSRLTWKYPGGKWKLYALFSGWHGKMVERAGPGGEGNVIDHFSAPALKNYLSRFDSAFQNHDIKSLRAFFNDSYEVDDAAGTSNWTPKLFEEFLKRRSYDLRHYLPELIANDNTEKSNRILCDYRETISELLLDNFTKPWADWAHKKSALVRNQAHGSPSNILDLYGTVDIPEIEGIEPLRIKMASSAANVTGKKLASAEAATWLNEHFESNLGNVKVALDRFMINGINHLVYHGTAYSPAEEAWPGWLFYAAVHFNSRNPFWKDLVSLNQYVARCQSFLQNTSPDNDILLYYPVYDRFSTPGKEMLEHFDGIGKQFEGTSFARCADSLSRLGYTFDYISDKQISLLQNSSKTLVSSGGASYRAMIVPFSKFIPASTFQKVYNLAQHGATIIFYEGLPESFSGFGKMKEDSATFDMLTSKLSTLDPSKNISSTKTGNGVIMSGMHLDGMLAQTSVRKETMVNSGLNFIRKKDPNGGIIYFINNNTPDFIKGKIPLTTITRSVGVFDPMTGASGKIGSQGSADNPTVYLELAPQQSLILKADASMSSLNQYSFYKNSGSPLPLAGPWKVEFIHGGPELPATLETDSLGSWTWYGEAYTSFSGSASYSTTFTLPENNSRYWRLTLGQVKESASVYLNDQHVGTLLGPDYSLTIDRKLLLKQNRLKVVVTNLMANRIAYMDRDAINWKIFYNINFPSRKPENSKGGIFDASAWKPTPSGLLGPVEITPILRLQ